MPLSLFALNLCWEEFLYYQTCPQKFRIHRLLNPVPDPSTFMTTRRPLKSYALRGYSPQTLEGLEYHRFFEQFHRKYFPMITNEQPPPEILLDDVKHCYWLQQQKKYCELDAEYWFPRMTEVSLMTSHQRGRIDCLHYCPDKDGLRLTDYKPRPSPDDELSLLFYAQLVNSYRQENKYLEYEWIEMDVVEASCYYYKVGRERVVEVTEEKLTAVTQELEETLTHIADELFPFQTKRCWSCNYQPICQLEQIRRK
ncbi:MAG: hypothetical protein GF308_07000 [Candidatus Heimdallarchaeota archaeon]|nr:hypothetical protein [Candidatus Heimdallarchaeota archaeon]